MMLWIDGFDELPPTGTATYLGTAGYLGAAGVGTATGRGDTGQCLVATGTDYLVKIIPTLGASDDLFVIGFGFRYTVGLANADILTLDTASTTQITLSRNTSNGLKVTIGSDTVTTPHEVIQGNVWAYIELALSWDADSGANHVTIRVNNIEVASGSAFSILGTAPDRLFLRGGGGSAQHFDDLYILNGDGTHNNGFLGDIYVENAYIESGADSAEFVPMGSVSNYLNINDTGVAVETLFNASDEIGARDVFNVRDLNIVGDQLFAVQLGARIKKVGSGFLGVSSLAILGGTEVQSPAFSPDASYRTYYFMMDTDPSGAQWAVPAFNAMRVGYELTY